MTLILYTLYILLNYDQVDAINFYQAEEAELKKACEEEKETAYQTPLGIAFITLASESQAQR